MWIIPWNLLKWSPKEKICAWKKKNENMNQYSDDKPWGQGAPTN